MANYPSYAQMQGSIAIRRDDLQADYAVNGDLHQRGYYDVVKKDFRIKHRLSSGERNTLDNFYNDNRKLTFSFVWAGDGLTYTCRFVGPPQPVWNENWYDVDVNMAEA